VQLDVIFDLRKRPSLADRREGRLVSPHQHEPVVAGKIDNSLIFEGVQRVDDAVLADALGDQWRPNIVEADRNTGFEPPFLEQRHHSRFCVDPVGHNCDVAFQVGSARWLLNFPDSRKSSQANREQAATPRFSVAERFKPKLPHLKKMWFYFSMLGWG